MDGTQESPRAVVLDSLLTVAEVAEALRVSYRSVGRLFDRGELAFVQVGGRRLVEDSELAAYVARHRQRRAPEAL
jgi:excisionase family DNA binding protein